jgi:hypothetical protein
VIFVGSFKKLSLILFFSVSVLILFIPVDAPVKENVNSEDSLIQKCIQKNYKNTDFLQMITMMVEQTKTSNKFLVVSI